MEDVEKRIVQIEEKVNDRSLAYEILSELKQTIRRLWIVILALAFVIVIQFCINTYERLQYDYTSSVDAIGMYTAVDHSGNIVTQDVSPEQWDQFLEWMEVNGESKSIQKQN